MKRVVLLACVAAVAASAITAFGAEKVFTGAVDAKWSTPGNWQGGEIPVDGDAVTLASTVRTTINNDIEGLTLASFTFSGYGTQGASGGNNQAYLQGKPVKIAAGGAIQLTSTVRINQQMTIELLEGTHELVVSKASGARWDTLSAGFSGAGSLTLTQGLLVIYAASTFTGGFTAKNGSNTYLFHSNGLGAGAVTFENNAYLVLYKAGITIPNDITFNGENWNTRQTGNIALFYSATFTGAITMNGQQRIMSDSSHAAATLTFKGPVTQTSGLFVTNLNAPDLRHEIVFENVYTAVNTTLHMDGSGSVVRFRAPGNRFSTTYFYSGRIYFETNGACVANNQLCFRSGSAVGAIAYMEGAQAVKRLYPHSNSTGNDYAITSQNGGELTVAATQNNTWPGRLEGKLGFVWAPTGNYTFDAQGACTMSGRLVVSNGTFSVASGQAGLPNISSLVLVNSGSLVLPSGASIHTRLDTLELSSNATLTLPSATAFTVDRFIVDGDDMPEDVTYTGGAAVDGMVHCDALPANVTVYARVRPGPAARTVWNGAGGTTDAMNLDVNWDGGVAPRLWEKCLPVFAGGSSATLVANTKVNGLAFETAGAFSVNGAYALDLYWGGLSAANSGANNTECNLNVPVRICSEQVWSGLAGGNTKVYNFNRPITDEDEIAYPIVITNGALVAFNATNTFSGDVTLHSGRIELGENECLGNPARGMVTIRRPSNVAAYLSFGPNVKVSRPIALYGPDENFYPVRSANTGTNELAGPVILGDTYKRFSANGTATLLFTGGVTGKGMFYIQGTGKYVVTDNPINTTGPLYSDVKADLSLKVGGNSVSYIGWIGGGSVMRLETDNPFIGNPNLMVEKGSTIFLNGHDMRVGNLQDRSSTTSNSCTVTSAKPATLIATTSGSDQTAHVKFEGAASFIKAGPKAMGLRSVSTSTGSVCAVQSTIHFMNGEGWTNGTVVVSNNNAAVMFDPGALLGRNVDVYLSNGGRLTLVDDAHITCRNLYLDGVRQRLGTYGNAASTAGFRSDTYFMTGNTLRGILHVRGESEGTIVIFR